MIIIGEGIKYLEKIEMAQSSYEVVRRAIQFQYPDRLPVIMPTLGISDVVGVGWN